MRVIKEAETAEDQEREESEESQNGERITHESRAVRRMDGEKRRSQESITYDAEDH